MTSNEAVQRSREERMTRRNIEQTLYNLKGCIKEAEDKKENIVKIQMGYKLFQEISEHDKKIITHNIEGDSYIYDILVNISCEPYKLILEKTKAVIVEK